MSTSRALSMTVPTVSQRADTLVAIDECFEEFDAKPGE